MKCDPRCQRCHKRIPDKRVDRAIEVGAEPRWCSPVCKTKAHNARMYLYRKIRRLTRQEFMCKQPPEAATDEAAP